MLSSVAINQIAKIDSEVVDSVVESINTGYRKYTTQELLGPKPPKDVDLVGSLYEEIKKTIGEAEANYFLSDPGVSFARDKFSLVQRVVINRFLIDRLVRYRAYFDVDGMSALFNFISMEGDHLTWYQRLYSTIIPWCKDHAVIKFFIDKEELEKQARLQTIQEHIEAKTTAEG